MGSTDIKEIKVYGKGGPNPPKVAFLLEELGVPHHILDIAFADVKGPEVLAVNPNGRVPVIYDENTDLTLWESGAIMLYLVEKYDKDHKFSFPPGSNEAHLANQWLFFQTSGQGPYYGQAAWFKIFHHEKVPSALERYTKEINRVCGVLEGHLEKQKVHASSDGPWLVGGRFSFADLCFLSWQLTAEKFFETTEYNPNDFPQVKEWVQRMANRTAVKTVLKNNEQLKGH